MKVAVTGASGFLGRYIIKHFVERGYCVRGLKRRSSVLGGISEEVISATEWYEGDLLEPHSLDSFIKGSDCIIHSALYRASDVGFRGAEGDLQTFLKVNFLSSIYLIEKAYQVGVSKFIFISTCAVHEVILDDRPLDEAHPLWPTSHYGAHKAAVEKFVHSFGLGKGYDVCAVRPTGIYGINYPLHRTKWYSLVKDICEGRDVYCEGGGKEVFAGDVAASIELLVKSTNTAGQVYNCYDMYVSNFKVAQLAKEFTGSVSKISGKDCRPKHEISTEKIRKLGMHFSGEAKLREEVKLLTEKIREEG